MIDSVGTLEDGDRLNCACVCDNSQMSTCQLHILLKKETCNVKVCTGG